MTRGTIFTFKISGRSRAPYDSIFPEGTDYQAWVYQVRAREVLSLLPTTLSRSLVPRRLPPRDARPVCLKLLSVAIRCPHSFGAVTGADIVDFAPNVGERWKPRYNACSVLDVDKIANIVKRARSEYFRLHQTSKLSDATAPKKQCLPDCRIPMGLKARNSNMQSCFARRQAMVRFGRA